MRPITPGDVQQIILDTRTFAFLDVLGYGTVASGTRFTDPERIRHMVAVWESLLSAVDASKKLYPDVDTVLFSDSLYLAHIDPLVVAAFVCHLYVEVASYHSHLSSEWMPWLRAGITIGWAIDVRDPTIPFGAPDPTACYRNPAGPGPARAYYLAEKTGLKGSRIIVDYNTVCNVAGSIAGVSNSNSSAAIRFAANKLAVPWPQAGTASIDGASCTLYDLPWWRFLTLGNAEALSIYKSHAWQINPNDGRAVAHQSATMQLLTKGG